MNNSPIKWNFPYPLLLPISFKWGLYLTPNIATKGKAVETNPNGIRNPLCKTLLGKE